MNYASLYRGFDPRGRERVREACAFADAHLSGLRRRSGETYAVHGCEIALTLRERGDDPSLCCVAILHDILVDPRGTLLLRRAPLTTDERKLIVQMHGLRRLHIDAKTEDLDKVIDAFADDARLLALRMAHRLNDIRHLSRFPLGLRKSIAKETLHMYTAIAGRLGMDIWRHEMEDKSFAIVQPEISRDIHRMQEASAALDQECLLLASRYLHRALRAQKLSARLENRMKTIFSTYRKMAIKQRSFHELTDRIAIRIVVSNVMDCYRALAVVHGCMHPMPGKLKDYIGAPKENGYQSIHTVVYPLPGVTEQPIEIQIRTEAMHSASEFGPSRHADYKRSMYALRSKPSRVNLFRNLQSLRAEARTPRQFSEALRRYFREDQIALFDQDNNLYHMPKPATALDFACHAHARRFPTLKAVRVNGRARPLDTILADGDTVEALFGRSRTIQPSWADWCRHGSAHKAIETLLNQRQSTIRAYQQSR